MIMAGFEKVLLATGEPRAEYIRRRLAEGANVKTITAEINAPGFYSGPEGKKWPESTVYAEKRKAAPKPAAKVEEPPAEEPALEVPPEYEDILTPEDIVEVQAEAAAALKKKQRAQARKELLAKATQELEREARLAAQRGVARGDMVDVHIDLAPYAPDIRLDGQRYEHGRTYRVPRKVYAVLAEIMQRSWQHQEGLNGKNERPYRRTLVERGITANNYQAAAVRA
jgi:hypothetical protein